MSEFECSMGHMVPPSKITVHFTCPYCGSPITTMDGLTSKQMEGLDSMEREVSEEECWPEEKEVEE